MSMDDDMSDIADMLDQMNEESLAAYLEWLKQVFP